ncbi:hypothetical protein [Bombella intestini]|uniref:hypothetical protein n=1 Tax=Bombella intestini TaxID=1539051 RepID=UPI001178391B|nr:hypothetical protein [Bombella intestini]
MVMPRPSLSTLPLPTASTGRSSTTMPAGRGSVRSSSGKNFAGVLADQAPSDHSEANISSPAESGRDTVPEKKGTDEPAKSTGRPDDALHSAVEAQDKAAGLSSVGVSRAEEEKTEDEKAGADPHAAEQQEQGSPQGHDEVTTASLNMQALSLAALMASPQPVQVSSSGALQSAQTGGTGMAMAFSNAGSIEALSHNDQSSRAGLGMALTGNALAGNLTQATASATAMSASSTTSHLSQALLSMGTVGSAATAPTSAMTSFIAGAMEGASSHSQQQPIGYGNVSSGHATGERQTETTLMASQQAAQASATAMSATQAMKDRTFPTVQTMSFQPSTAGILPVSASMVNGASATSRQDDTRNGSTGQPDSLFSLMVKASPKESELSFAGGGEQGSAGSEQGMAGHGGTVSTDVSAGDSGQEMPGNLSSFAGLVTTSEGRLIQPEAHSGTAGVVTSEARQMTSETGLFALQGSSAAGVLTGRAVAGQAGTLTMTVTTADSTSVHVQLDRSAAGMSALSLQGQDDGTTEALQKTHHVLARQLDEAGLHAGLMKIDVLPADAGHMAGGQDRNTSQHQGQGGYQASGQHTGQSSFQQEGGFFAGGESGRQQDQRSQQGRDLSAPLQQEPFFRAEGDDVAAPATTRSVRTGYLNISV